VWNLRCQAADGINSSSSDDDGQAHDSDGSRALRALMEMNDAFSADAVSVHCLTFG
jgi:hypothetical protein